MKIPKIMAQFDQRPALFMASGEYEAKFYLALNGEISLINTLKMPPREEAREKQAFVGIKGGRYGLAAVSHKGGYIEDLKKKFARKVHGVIHDILAKYDIMEIHFFTPRFVSERVIQKLDKSERKKVKLIISKEFTKKNPLEMIKILSQQEEQLTKPVSPIKKEAEKILRNKKD